MFESLFDILFPVVFLSVPVMASLGIARFVFGQDNVIWACKTAGRWMGTQATTFGWRVTDAAHILFCGTRTSALLAECDELRSRILSMEDDADYAAEAIYQLQNYQLQKRVTELEQASEALSTQVEGVAGPF